MSEVRVIAEKPAITSVHHRSGHPWDTGENGTL